MHCVGSGACVLFPKSRNAKTPHHSASAITAVSVDVPHGT